MLQKQALLPARSVRFRSGDQAPASKCPIGIGRSLRGEDSRACD